MCSCNFIAAAFYLFAKLTSTLHFTFAFQLSAFRSFFAFSPYSCSFSLLMADKQQREENRSQTKQLFLLTNTFAYCLF